MLFASFYLVLFFFALVVFAALWRSIRSFDVSLAALRVLFTGLATLFFAPMIVPAGTIVTAWVPHAALLVAPSLGYYFWVPEFVLRSFGMTALVSLLVAITLIRQRPEPRGVDWRTWSYPLIAIGATVLAYKLAFPDREIPAEISSAAVEAVYGGDIDQVIALHQIGDPAQQAAAVARLKDKFLEDDAIIHVLLEDPGHRGSVYGQVFYFYQDDVSPARKRCSGSVPPEQKGLIRCSWRGGGASRSSVIKYSRYFTLGDEQLVVVFEFDFKALKRSLRDAAST